MKQCLLLISAATLLLSLASCQQPAKQAAPAVIRSATSVAKIEATEPEAVVAPVANIPDRELTPEMSALLGNIDLSALWLNKQDNATSVSPMEGFFGSDHYRISFVFTSATRDKTRPELFWVQGKSRYKKKIVPFSGSIQIQQLIDLNTYIDIEEPNSARAYTALAHFVFQQQTSKDEIGIFEGEGYLDWYITRTGEVGLVSIMAGDDNPTKGRGLLFRGQWTSNTTGVRQPVLWAPDVFAVAPEIFKDFGIGDRGSNVNPKYLKLGWDTIWENDEWWAEPGPVTARAAAPDSLPATQKN